MNDINFLQVQPEPPSRKCPTCEGSGYVRPAMRQDWPVNNCFHYFLLDSGGNQVCQKCGLIMGPTKFTLTPPTSAANP